MAVLVFVVLILAISGHSADANWCVCRSDASESALQKALDYACGAGADCKPILQNGACFQPNTVRAHCSYAVNSYFQNKGQAQGTCDFSSSATPVTTDPSPGGTCTFPATASTGGVTVNPPTTTTPSTTTPPGTTTPSTNTPISGALTPPSTFTPTTPGGMIGGGIGSGLGPSGTGINTDTSDEKRMKSGGGGGGQIDREVGNHLPSSEITFPTRFCFFPPVKRKEKVGLIPFWVVIWLVLGRRT
ncbi:X8 [Macleaya cordata]|uniref:X8 n=1 Tax=Macleaya cordata TaxID=56857 RepID=A0A200R861_MACCD|nr:X8 [Macleaya cordata]